MRGMRSHPQAKVRKMVRKPKCEACLDNKSLQDDDATIIPIYLPAYLLTYLPTYLHHYFLMLFVILIIIVVDINIIIIDMLLVLTLLEKRFHIGKAIR